MNFEAYDLNVINQRWGEDKDDFFIQLYCEVREKSQLGGEAFNLYMVSPKAFLKEFLSDNSYYEFGHSYLFVNDFEKKYFINYSKNA